MRGYNQQKDSTNNSQESFLSKNIEDYTIKDCEDFLAKYPKDIDADKVRKKEEELKSLLAGLVNDSISPKHEQPKILQSQNSAISSDEKSTSQTETQFKSKIETGMNTFWRIVFVLLCVFWACWFVFLINWFFNYENFKWKYLCLSVFGALSSLGWAGEKADIKI